MQAKACGYQSAIKAGLWPENLKGGEGAPSGQASCLWTCPVGETPPLRPVTTFSAAAADGAGPWAGAGPGLF